MTATGDRPSVLELRAAARALRAGQFRTAGPTDPVGSRWVPAAGERAVVVVGVSGGVGTTTVAVATATAAAPARVVECGPVTRSGLVAASFNELGAAGEHWARGRRGPVILERRTDAEARIPPPLPTDSAAALTVIDAGEVDTAYRTGWLAGLLNVIPTVVVARATLPSLRHLEAVLARLDPLPILAVAVVGPPRRRWPKALVYALGEHTRAVVADDRCVCVPLDAGLGVAGLTEADLPAPLRAAGTTLAALAAEPESESEPETELVDVVHP